MKKVKVPPAPPQLHYLQPLVCADDDVARQKAAAVQATKARKLRDKLFTQRMEELAAELCAQYIQTANSSSPRSPRRNDPDRVRSHSPPHIPPEVIQARIAKLQEEIQTAVALEADRASNCSAMPVRAPAPPRAKAQQGGVLITRGLRGRNEEGLAAEQPRQSTLTGRLRHDGNIAGLSRNAAEVEEEQQQPSLPRLRLTTRNNMAEWEDYGPYMSARSESPIPLSIATVDHRYREPTLFMSLDVLLDGNTKALSARTPRALNAVERALKVVPEVPFSTLMLSATDFLGGSARKDIRSNIPDKGYLADLLERKRKMEQEEQEACAKRAETGWSPRDSLASDAAHRRRLHSK